MKRGKNLAPEVDVASDFDRPYDRRERKSSQHEGPLLSQSKLMAMAMVAASFGTSLALQSAACLPRLEAPAICTSVFQIRARVGDCYRSIPWSRRKVWREIPVLLSSRDSSKTSSRRRCWPTTANGEIMEGDVVEYPLPEKVRQGGLYGDRSYGLGAVQELALDNSTSNVVCHIEPLVMNDPLEATWIVDERQDMVVVLLSEVRRLEAWVSMRMVDDRISNPHGEHAEHLWLVEEPLSEGSGSPVYDAAPSNYD